MVQGPAGGRRGGGRGFRRMGDGFTVTECPGSEGTRRGGVTLLRASVYPPPPAESAGPALPGGGAFGGVGNSLVGCQAVNKEFPGEN